jgi:hypothetical protein
VLRIEDMAGTGALEDHGEDAHPRDVGGVWVVCEARHRHRSPEGAVPGVSPIWVNDSKHPRLMLGLVVICAGQEDGGVGGRLMHRDLSLEPADLVDRIHAVVVVLAQGH